MSKGLSQERAWPKHVEGPVPSVARFGSGTTWVETAGHFANRAGARSAHPFMLAESSSYAAAASAFAEAAAVASAFTESSSSYGPCLRDLKP